MATNIPSQQGINPALYPGVPPDIIQQVQDMLNLQYGGQQAETQRGLDTIQQQLQSGIGAQQQLGTTGDQKLKEIYDALQGNLQQGVAQQGALYAGAGQQIGQGYDTAQKAAEDATEAVKRQIQASSNQLGLNAALPDPLSRLAAELETLKARNASSKAGAVGNLQALGANVQGIKQMGVESAGKEGASRRANLTRDVQKAIAQLQLGSSQESNKLLGHLVDIAGQRGSAERSGISKAMSDRATQEQRRREFDITSAIKQQQADASSIRAAKTGSGSRGGGKVDPLLALKARQYEDVHNAALKKLQGKGADRFYNTLGSGTDARGNAYSQEFQDFMQDYIGKMEGLSSQVDPATGKAPNAYKLAMQHAATYAKSNPFGKFSPKDIQQLVNIFYGK